MQISGDAFTNEQCNFLVSQFESFARQFNKSFEGFERRSETDSASNFSTAGRKTLNTNSVFKHEVGRKVQVEDAILDEEAERVVAKLCEEKARVKTSFVEVSLAEPNPG